MLISEGQANALKEYFKHSKEVPELWCKNVIIDNCKLADADFATIISGLIDQGPRVQKLTYSHGQFDLKSC